MGITVFHLFAIFLSFKFGDDFKSVEKNIQKNPIFYYDVKEVEFSFTETQMLKFNGKSPLKYSYFNFDKNKLYSYTFVFDKRLISQYSIFLAIKEKFGDATVVTPFNYLWYIDNVIIALNNNILRMTLKSYIDKVDKTN
ncbi:hypothetical protein [Borrelia sp. HM]|uniref:hypothetical protein n=1 Tax=Borrelia sp. HM TaxID=1882662 RepID=UPI001C74454F|nr:hypothetical protein [Borrelia sp. HM]BCR22072.1 hypothetical protein BKFM_00661 [Borrelia sp. HM]